MQVGTEVGYFGKVPTLGDFVSRGLPPSFLEVWDPWLQRCLSESRTTLGEDWLDAYLVGPIWRFALTPGVCGDTAWAGVLMPSVDKVGRYFPMTLAVAINVNPVCGLFRARPWYGALEELALSCLQDEFDIEALNGQLRELPWPLEGDHETNSLDVEVGRHGAWRVALVGSPPVPPFEGLLHHFLRREAHAYSLWSTEGSDRVAPSLLYSAALPGAVSFSALLNGNWAGSGWAEVSSPEGADVIAEVLGDKLS